MRNDGFARSADLHPFENTALSKMAGLVQLHCSAHTSERQVRADKVDNKFGPPAQSSQHYRDHSLHRFFAPSHLVAYVKPALRLGRPNGSAIQGHSTAMISGRLSPILLSGVIS